MTLKKGRVLFSDPFQIIPQNNKVMELKSSTVISDVSRSAKVLFIIFILNIAKPTSYEF